MHNWQPIETAPKTGKRILICGGKFWWDGDSCPTEGEIKTGTSIAAWDGEHFYDGEFWFQPMYWQPVPEPIS